MTDDCRIGLLPSIEIAVPVEVARLGLRWFAIFDDARSTVQRIDQLLAYNTSIDAIHQDEKNLEVSFDSFVGSQLL